MPNLYNVLSSALAESYNEPWLPGTETILIRYVEHNLLKPRGLLLENYGTARYIQQDHRAPLNVMFSLARPRRLAIVVENIPFVYFAKYHNIGLYQRQWGQRDDDDVAHTILNAVSYFEACPSLLPIIETFLRCIHVIVPPSDPFDISYSDPDLPLSAFVSAPPKQAKHAALRVCESLLHECMHLQLSIVEQNISLVRHHKPTLRSPWRSDLRPPIGLLHGIYVFRAILKFFEWLERTTKNAADLEYIQKRQREIRPELKQAHLHLRASDLTTFGIDLVVNT